MRTLKDLIDTVPQVGEVLWIGVRPDRKTPMLSVQTLEATPESGLEGDRYRSSAGARQVTLVQAEHLSVIGSVLGRDSIPPELLRRNVVVRGINLFALKDREVMIGSVLLKVTGLCHPCSRMEKILGSGGYNAVRGHGGITARILKAGILNVGDTVRVAVPVD